MDELTIFEAAHVLGCTPPAARWLLVQCGLAKPATVRFKLDDVEALAVEEYRWRQHTDDPDSYWVAVGQAAEILGISAQRVKQLLDVGKLPHQTHRDGTRLMRRRQLETVANARESRKLR